MLQSLNKQDWHLPEKVEQIFAFKALDACSVQILTDPWTDTSAIWQLDIAPGSPVQLYKVKDFGAYRNEPYTEDVVW